MEKLYANKLDEWYWACYRFIRDKIFTSVWYRFFGHKHHIVKTGLKPCPWIDADQRILYSVMAIVEWFVKNDMRIITPEEFQKEIDRIKKEEPADSQKGFIEAWTDQYKQDQEIIGIYTWWQMYPNRLEEIDESLHEWSEYSNSLVEKYDLKNFFKLMNNTDKLTEEERKKDRELLDKHHEQEKKLQEEEQEYLKKAINLRMHMWN
jgi:hypothetical protein